MDTESKHQLLQIESDFVSLAVAGSISIEQLPAFLELQLSRPPTAQEVASISMILQDPEFTLTQWLQWLEIGKLRGKENTPELEQNLQHQAKLGQLLAAVQGTPELVSQVEKLLASATDLTAAAAAHTIELAALKRQAVQASNGNQAQEAAVAEEAGAIDPGFFHAGEHDTPAEVEEFREKIDAKKEALWRDMKATGRFERAQDGKVIRAAREDFARATVDAQKLKSTPDWVEGPRPSDELIAMGGPGDRFAPAWDFPAGWQKHFLNNRLPNTPGNGFDMYELPSSFKGEPIDANGVRCAWANWPGTDTQEGVILYMHGGGAVMGNIDLNYCARISCASGLRVLTVDYRLAPEHLAAVGIEDIIKAYLWLTQTTSPGQVVVYGTSWGGYLVMAFLQGLLRHGHQLPACAVCGSPTLPQFGVQDMMWCLASGIKSWTGKSTGAKAWEQVLSDPSYNILGGQLQGLPPIYVSVGSLEHVENQVKPAKALAEACRNAGVQVDLDVARNLQHTPCQNLFLVPEADAFVAREVAFMHKHLSGHRHDTKSPNI